MTAFIHQKPIGNSIHTEKTRRREQLPDQEIYFSYGYVINKTANTKEKSLLLMRLNLLELGKRWGKIYRHFTCQQIAIGTPYNLLLD